jgi:exonuclease SbcC
MKLLRLELQHWCQHSQLDLTFPDEPIILLSGSNNSGKSNLVRAIGRVLALGRSEFGDASAIQYGAKQASLRLTALTHERAQFTISREIKPRQTRAKLEFEDKTLTNAEEIQTQLQEWFGRQETLLELFIAPQGQIASLLKERGKERLTQFIEICGFKGFLQKQATLNKFVRAYPTVLDPSPLLQDVEGKLQQIEKRTEEKKAAIQALPAAQELQRELNSLHQIKTLRESAEKELSAKKEKLAQTQAGITQPLPDLEELQKRIQTIRAALVRSQVALRHQKVEKARRELSRAQQELAGTPEDNTNYTQQLQESSDALQKKINRRSEIARDHQALEHLRAEVEKLEKVIAESRKTLAELKHSQNWYGPTLDQISQLHAASHQFLAQEHGLSQQKERLAQYEQVRPPSPEVLKACKASEAKLQEIVGLHRHASAATDHCLLCQRPWEKPALVQRRNQLDALAKELQADLKKSPQAAAEYQRWTQAQTEIPKLRQQIQQEETACAGKRRELNAQMAALHLPENEITEIPIVIAGYQKVRAAMTPPTQEAHVLREKAASASLADHTRAVEDAQLAHEIEQGSARIRELLGKQTTAHENARKRARLKQQTEMIQGQLVELADGPGAKPEDYHSDTDYTELCRIREEELSHAQDGFQKASGDWTNRFAQLRNMEALKSEIASTELKLQTLVWGTEQEARIAELQKAISQLQHLAAEIDLLQQQSGQLRQQLNELGAQKEKFDQQTRNVADLEAVSRFLSYDNGPLKFLTSFFQEALNQTNLLLTEMELPVKLHLGADLEIMVEDRNTQSSSALVLGGGYSSLVGIAFRIALQRMILPRVHVLILDEPSTHIDEANMDLLMPFFDKLKENISHYGIEQCLVIDHHPGWRNTTSAVIELDNKGSSGELAEAAAGVSIENSATGDFEKTAAS